MATAIVVMVMVMAVAVIVDMAIMIVIVMAMSLPQHILQRQRSSNKLLQTPLKHDKHGANCHGQNVSPYF